MNLRMWIASKLCPIKAPKVYTVKVSPLASEKYCSDTASREPTVSGNKEFE